MNAIPKTEFLLLAEKNGRLDITFNRPEQRNAINNAMAAEFAAVVEWLENTPDIRLVVLRGAGGHFCAGGDIKERKNQATTDAGDGGDPLAERNANAGLMFRRFEYLPQTTIAVVEGSAFGGGMGYACLADITILSTSARMGMPETTLGVAPAQIAPYVVKRIGLTRARQLALTAERFDGKAAYEYGIGQYLAEPEELEAITEEVAARVLKCGPAANAATKDIMLQVGKRPDEDMIRYSAEKFAALNRSPEGIEGQTAFAEKRKPSWQVEQ
ncbi:enoyl-CoA hydratase/isomerase family protein [Sneathiella chinensis]|uniref:Isohexenylglutaconyl-CoA hydratase n=1 Tax=Sneathiella chinensis TaxID=349750 RepID=A0ABQ5U1J9_9PROT|nr:enoyl-CoA hydratase-related protein [Sneathiella chinensis]GLQ05551.1 isohexenylglutaconyl-CoA hydratase [Sneathiella chinensis]